MESYSIRFAEYNDIPKIMKYIDDYWQEGHILAMNRDLFEWQYVNDGRVNFVIALDGEYNIQGILGFIPYGDADNKDIALALWKVNRSESFLGIRLLLFLKKEECYRHIVCPGINMQTTSKIYTHMGMKVDIMKQWYRLRESAKYVIGKIENIEIPQIGEEQYKFELLTDSGQLGQWEFFNNSVFQHTPFKSKEYVEKRYFNHPIYNYLVFAVKNSGSQVSGLVILRVQEYLDSRVFRFVDFIGPEKVLLKITSELDRLMKEYNVEYIDMYETGIKDDILLHAGWKEVKGSGNIIPNYFSPYEQNNVDIYYCTSDSHAILFRGDGDQDRPN